MDFQTPDAAATAAASSARRMMTVMREKATQKVKYDDEEGSDDNVAASEEGEEERIHDIEEKRQRRQLTGSTGRRVTGGGGGGLSCQADKCTADLTEAKRYHRRHKVCEFHAKSPSVLVSALRQRFCQQCSRFHELSEFDESKRSCRRRLAGHNERRRKNTSEPNGEADGSSSSGRMKGPSPHCGPNDPERPNRVQMPYPGNPVFKYR